jgi:sn1-specific diacylglycerol lipase
MVNLLNLQIKLQFISCFIFLFRLCLIVIVYIRYYEYTWECTSGGDYVRSYIIGMLALLSTVILVLIALINRSAQGSITDVQARRYVPPILLLKVFLIIPETVLNVFGTMWAFCGDVVVCHREEHFSKTVIEGTF